MFVADSDVLIDFLRGHGEGAKRIALELTTRSLRTTAINAFELKSGAHTPRKSKLVDELLDAMTILPFGPDEAGLAAEIKKDLESRGQGIGMADYMIGAVCISNDAVLITRNQKHFGRISDLKLSGAGHL